MGIMDTVNNVARLVQAAENPDLAQAYMGLQNDVYKIWEDLKEKDETINQLQETLSLKGKLVCKGSAYFLVDENNKPTDGPFCTKCFDVDHNKCRLVQIASTTQVQCLKCKVPFRSNPAAQFLQTGDNLNW